MNKFFMFFHNPNYIFEHFEELSVEDFFYIANKIQIPSSYISKNDLLSKNSNVLNYMLDIDNLAFRHFQPEAFSPECVNKIANLNIQYTLEDIEKFPVLLDNDILLNKLFTQNPKIILKIHNLSDNIVKTALNHGYMPVKKDFYSNPQLINYDVLLEKAFEKDPSVIVLFRKPLLNESITMTANRNGYIASEADLMENEELCHFNFIMEPAIKNNPKLIIYTAKNCAISSDLISTTLSKYKITENDLNLHPELTQNYQIMSYLPEFYLYSPALSIYKKQDLLFEKLKNLKDGEHLTVNGLPFLDSKFGAKIDVNKLDELLGCLKLSFDENDIDTQQGYFYILDKIIDGVINVEYKKNKFTFKFQDIVSLNDAMIELFNNIETTQNYELIDDFANELYIFIGKQIPFELLKSKINYFFHKYLEIHMIYLSTTQDFCNKILNLHRNEFIKNEKRKVTLNVTGLMTLNDKITTKITNGRKIKKLKSLIKNNEYAEFNASRDLIEKEIETVENIILENKDIKKLNLTKDLLDILGTYFINNGEVTRNICEDIGITNHNAIKFIIRKFSQIYFNYINYITLSPLTAFITRDDKTKIAFNCNNFLIADKNKYYRNLSELLLSIDKQQLDKILENKSILNEVAPLLLFVNLIDEFSMKTFINIITSYGHIKNKLCESLDNSINRDYTKLIIERFADLITLADAFILADDIVLYALGRNIVSKVGEEACLKYLQFYLSMIYKQKGNIPPISLKTPKYNLESGLYSDPDRLLIGKVPDKYSCIDLLHSAGVATYMELLLENSGDVILIKDKLNQLVSRILVFRRGNLIQMVTKHSEYYPINLYEQIADQMMQKINAHNDNVDYIFVNSISINEKTDKIVIEDNRFITKFLHADFGSSAVLIRAKKEVAENNEHDIKLNFDRIMDEGLYNKRRKKISYLPTETEVTRIKALDVFMEFDPAIRQQKASLFKPFIMSDYEKVICGEDWYIAIDKNGKLEELILPTSDLHKYEEINQVKKILNISINKKL